MGSKLRESTIPLPAAQPSSFLVFPTFSANHPSTQEFSFADFGLLSLIDRERMYKARLSQWGISKNYSDKDYQICSVLNHYRQKHGKRATAFMIHGHKRSLKDLHKYVKGRKMTEDDFLANALANVDCKEDEPQPEQYAHVRAYTPEPEPELEEPPSLPGPPRALPTSIVANINPAPAPNANMSPSMPSRAMGLASYSAIPTSSRTSSFGPIPDATTSQKRSPRLKASPPLPLPLALATQHSTSPVQRRFSGRSAPRDTTASWSLNSPLSSRGHPVASPQGTPSSYAYSTANEPLSSFEDQVRHAGTFYDSSPTMACQRLGRDVELMALQVMDAPHLRSLCGHDDIRTWSLMMTDSSSSPDSMDYEQICPTCHESTSEHFISLPNLELPQQPRNILNVAQDVPASTMSIPTTSRGHDHSWRWVARCFAACIYLRRGNDLLYQQSLADADNEFERMLVPQQDPKILLALNQTLQILQMHNQGELAKALMSNANSIAERIVGAGDPLAIILRWMVCVSDGTMLKSGITADTIRDIHERFAYLHGLEDPRSIASKYCYGFMLNVERQLPEAEQILREVYDLSSRVLGTTHLQSISALTNLHRALQRQGRIDEAIIVLSRAIEDSKDTLGDNHPRRLESIRLLALLHKEQGNLGLTEELYWKVLEGRIKMLGRNHTYTQGMKVDLEALLKETGKWTIAKQVEKKTFDNTRLGGPSMVVVQVESPSQLRLQDLFEWDPHEHWEAGSEGGESEGTGSQHEAF
jgi:tetratricopeptide (TPR) repeat protein